MRTKILTDKEMEIIATYVVNGNKLKGFYTLKHRAKKHINDLKADISYLEWLL